MHLTEADDSNVAHIEERIEELSASIERCRKISFAAKLAIAAGGLWLAVTVLQLAAFNAALTFAALAAVIGGLVLLGSNKTTWDQLEAALRQATASRDALIGALPLHAVRSVTLH